MTVPMMRRREVEVGGRAIRLTRAETELVATLLAVRPRPLTVPQLADLIHRDDPDGGPLHNTVAVQICRLRRRGIPILNRRGLGFLL